MSEQSKVSLALDEIINAVAEKLAANVVEHLAHSDARAPDSALLTIDQLARALGTSPATIHRLRKMGMPTLWLIESPRFELESVLAWLRDGHGRGAVAQQAQRPKYLMQPQDTRKRGT